MSEASINVTIFHNPACGTSRNTLALIRNAGIEPEIIEYLKDIPSRAATLDLIQRPGLTVRQALRQKGTPYDDLDLSNPALTDDELLDAIQRFPILLNRPFVVTPWGVKLCRPSETALDILPLPQKGQFVKEDGEVIINADGKRVASKSAG